MARTQRLDALVAELAARAIGTTFNQYRDGGAGDRDPAAAPSVRCENLRVYLRSRAAAPVLLVAEAAGWRGARYSGIPLLSERQLDRSGPYRRTSTHPRGWAEASATIVRGVLRGGGWEEGVLVWNVVPTHPWGPVPDSNRPPSALEVASGRELLMRLLDVVRPRHVVALGRTAERALAAQVAVAAVRHPAQGGAARCRAELRDALTSRLG